MTSFEDRIRSTSGAKTIRFPPAGPGEDHGANGTIGAHHVGLKPGRPKLERRQLEPVGRTNIQPRRWLYGKYLIRGMVGCLAAIDGGGKGAMAIAIALSIITGRPLLGEKVWKAGRVAVISYEDDDEEWHRRIAAACEHYGLDYATCLAGFVFLRRPGEPLVFATMVESRIVYPDRDDIIEAVRESDAALLIVDPLNHAHGFDDGNNNVLMAKVAAAMEHLARETDASLLLLHHLRKTQTGSSDDIMGAVSVRATFRASRVLSRMTSEEANKLNIKEAWRYSRITGSKENYGPSPDKARWFKLESVALDNGTDEYPEGDNLQVCTTWTARPMFEGMDAEKLSAVFDAFRKSPYRSPVRQAANWAGKTLIEIGDRSEQEAKNILKAWIENGVLVENEQTLSKNKGLQCVRLDEAKAAEIMIPLTGGGLD